MPLGPGVEVVALDANGLAALDKPEGVLSHPNGPRDEATLAGAGPRYDEKDGVLRVAGARRAAREGSGSSTGWIRRRRALILVAADGALAREVRAQFQRRLVRKVYQALVFGKPRQPTETWRDVLGVKKQGGQIRTVGRRRQPACGERDDARARRLAGPVRPSLVRLEPRTGRSHQLRVQCAKRGLPIVGDRTYGDFGANREFARAGGPKRMFLHSLGIAFKYDFGGKAVCVCGHRAASAGVRAASIEIRNGRLGLFLAGWALPARAPTHP